MRLIGALVAVVVLVGCSPETVESPTPTPTPSPVETVVTPTGSPTVESPPPSPSPSPTPTAFQSYPVDLPTEDPETAAIIEGWQEYQRVYEKFAMDPFGFTDFTETQYVTVDPEASTILNRIQALRERNLEFLGGSVFRDVEVGNFGSESEGLRTAVLEYCADMNQASLRNRETEEIVERSGTYLEKALMVEGSDGVWRVSDFEVDEATC